MATPEQIDQLRWFASIPRPELQEATAETAMLIMDLIHAGLVFRNFTAVEATYDITPAGLEALHAPTV